MTPNNALSKGRALALAYHSTRCRALDLVRKHRPGLVAAMHYALDKHPEPYRSHWQALWILLEEVAEVVWALVRRDWPNLREELCHVEVVCVRWRNFAQEASGRTEGGRVRPSDVPTLSTRQDADSGEMDEQDIFVRRVAI